MTGSDNRPRRVQPAPSTAEYRGMNGPFRFRLERVRGLRERTEDKAKQALAVAIAHHSQGEQDVRRAEECVARAHTAQRDAASAPLSATDLLDCQAFLERAEQAQRASHEDLAQRERELASRRDELTRASQARQALERLKDHQRSEHEREAARLEGITLDEIAIVRYRRRAA